jgi:hypothetical protein
MGEGRVAHKVLVGKPEARRLLGRLKHKWQNNIKRLLNRNWIDLVEGRDMWQGVVSIKLNLCLSFSVGNFVNSCGAVSF